jgi:hypothetical protein
MEDAKRPASNSRTTTGDERRARLAAALRENLRKRKAQARARGIGEAGAERIPDPDPFPAEGGAKRG